MFFWFSDVLDTNDQRQVYGKTANHKPTPMIVAGFQFAWEYGYPEGQNPFGVVQTKSYLPQFGDAATSAVAGIDFLGRAEQTTGVAYRW